ncbi:MAG: glucosyltransferase domain-containing protein [Faecousia sp.]
MKETRFSPEKGLLMLSGTAFLLLIVPAWVPGFVWCGAAAVVLCLAVLRLPVSRQKIRELLSNPVHAALSLAVNGALGVNFYHNWVDSRYMERAAGLLGMNAELFVPLCGVFFALAAAPAVDCVLSYYISAGTADYRGRKSKTLQSGEGGIPMGKALLLLLAVYVLGISAILRANFYYMDDSPRAALGYKQWDYFSRFLSTALATLVHGGDYLVDAAPLPQILAMLLMAVSGILMLYIVYGRTAFSGWELAALIPLGLNPYFLGCVSFRFDAPYMAFSVLSAVVPLLYRNRSTAAYLLASMLGILAVCTSYQAATGIFPMLVIVLALRMWNRREPVREVGLFCLKSAAGYALGLVFFKLVIMIPADTGYAGNSLPSAGALIPHFLGNLREYYSLVLSDFKPFWLAAAALMIAGFGIRTVCGSRQKKLPALAVTAGALVLMGLLCFGLYPALSSTVFAPRAMYGFGVLITIFGITAAEGKKQIPLKVPVVVLSWVFFVFSFTYGNALSVQKDYTNFRTQMVISDLQKMEVFQSDAPVTVQLSGTIGKAPILKNMPQNYQMLNRLIPRTFGGGDDLTQYGFYCYYDLRNVVWDPEVDLREMELPVLEDTMYHTIRGEGSYVLVELK